MYDIFFNLSTNYTNEHEKNDCLRADDTLENLYKTVCVHTPQLSIAIKLIVLNI